MESVNTEEEVASVPPDTQSETQPSQTADIENPVLGSEQQTESPPIQNICGSFLTCCLPIPKPLYYLICCLLFLCFAPVAYALITVVTVAILPLLLTGVLVARFFQFFVKDVDVEKNYNFKTLLLYWVSMVVLLFLVEVGLFYSIAKYVPGLKLVMIIGLPITKWIEIICILIGLYLISRVIWLSLYVVQMKINRIYDKPHFLVDLISETISCLLLLGGEMVAMSSVPTFKHSKIFGICTQKWIKERARSSCMFLSNTFISENELAKSLNLVMRWTIIVVIFIMWLLLTGLASTKVLVIIASPALAAIFTFGDTAKGLFQGLVFVYIVHPFDVGDLCLIDGELLEVVRIGIWCTIFSNIRNVGEQQQVIYPNSVLSQKNVINYKTNFNWNDRIEFLCSQKITIALKDKIQSYLDHEKDKFTPNFHSVDLLEMGDKAKIVVHFKHNFSEIKGWTNFECLKAKEKRRFEFGVHVQNLVKELEYWIDLNLEFMYRTS